MTSRIIKNHLRLGFLFFIALLVPACGERTRELPPTEYLKAKAFSDAVAQDILHRDLEDLYKRLDSGFQTMISKPEDLVEVIKKMDDYYGKLLEIEFKAAKESIRVDGAWKRPSRIFWYAARTAKHPKGVYFLKIEIVTTFDGQSLSTSGFGLLTFNDKKIPRELQ